MAYKNPKPVLFGEKVGVFAPQEHSVAEYTELQGVYFSFIDVLGFKQAFDNREKQNNEFASSCKKVFQYFSLLMNNIRFNITENQWSAGQTSDSLYFYTTREDYLAAFIKIYSHFCLYAMSQNVFFRGGIAKGNLHVHRPHQFYGDSVIKAYLLENNIAKFPIIVIDQSTYSALKNDKGILKFLNEKEPPKRCYINPFVNISNRELQIDVNISDTDIHNIGDEEWKRIKTNIEDNMKHFEFDDKNYQKYAFLLSEYNDNERTHHNE